MTHKEESHVFLESSNSKGTKDNNMASIENDHNRKIVKIKKQLYPICTKLTIFTVVVLLIALIVLTIIREVQIKGLRDEVEFLRNDLTEFKNLVMEEGYMDDFKKFENEVNMEEGNKLPTGSPLMDDDYETEDDDSEYDSSSNLNIPDDGSDFLGEVMEGNLEDRSQFIDDIQPPIKKVMRVLRPKSEDGPKESNDRSRRHVMAETADGVPILEEPYHVAKARNMTHQYNGPPQTFRRVVENNQGFTRRFHGWDNKDAKNSQEERKRTHHKKYEESISSTASPGAVYTRPSRVMVTSEDTSKSFRRVFRRPMTRSGLSSDHEMASLRRHPEDSDGHRRRRRYRSQSSNLRNLKEDVEVLRPEKPIMHHNEFLVGHFNGDTKDFDINRHEHYDGNGRLRHPHDVPYTAWSPAHWPSSLNMNGKFSLDEGAVSVPADGIYFIYAQIYYHDEHDINGYRIFKNNGREDEVLLQCTTMTYSSSRVEKSNTCYTAGAFYLRREDNISIKNLGSMRYSIMEPGKSFFGLIKLGGPGREMK